MSSHKEGIFEPYGFVPPGSMGALGTLHYVATIVCSVTCLSVSGCTVGAVVCWSVSDSDRSLSSVRLYASIVLNLGLLVVL